MEKLKKLITLIIVDCQYDFIEGSMAVENAKNTVLNIANYITKNKESIDKVIFTADWHPHNHSSFKIHGGNWPRHCVQYSKGASIDDDLFSTVMINNLQYDVVVKGIHEDKEEYGAFSTPSLFKDMLIVENHECFINPDSDIVVCGIAGDYCVKETTKNLLGLNPKIFINGVASIDDGSTIKQFIERYNLEVVE